MRIGNRTQAFIIIIIIIYLSKTSKNINRANQCKNTYNIGLDAKVHVGLFNCGTNNNYLE